MLRCALILAILSGCDFIFRVDQYDGATDAAAGPLVLASSEEAHSDSPTDNLSIAMTIPAVPARLLIVSVQISVSGSDMPSVDMVTWNGAPLMLLDSAMGVMGSPNTRSEQWQLVAPVATAGTVAIHLTTQGDTVRASAMAFSGADQTTPIRALAHATGQGDTGMVTVASEVGDLVEATAGQGGGGIESTTPGQLVYVDTGNPNHPLDNAAGSTAAGGAPSVTVTWIFHDLDDWQTIAASIEPAAP